MDKKKGHVEFRPPEVKLVADMPGDEEMRANLDNMKENNGYDQSCGVESKDDARKTSHAEKLRYENADKIYE